MPNVFDNVFTGSSSGSSTIGTETTSLTAAVGSTASKTIVCNQSLSGLTLAISVQTKDKTVVATVADVGISKSARNATFSLTSAMTTSERTLRVLVTNTANNEVVASPLLFVMYDP